MKKNRQLMTAMVLLVGGCSQETQFSDVGGKVIEAEMIVGPPNADSTDPTGTGGTNPDGTARSGIGGSGTGGSGTGGSGTNGGDPSGGGAIPPNVVADNVENLKLACSSGTKKQIKQSIRFGEVQKCNWNVNGNLGRLDMHVQAMEGQKAAIELPVNARLCDLGIGSAATTIQYDDFMVLTLNNQVLLTSNKELLVNVEQNNDMPYVWDFSRVRGQAIDWDATSYCLGNDASFCKIPLTDVQGSFQFSIAPDSLGKLANNSVDKKRLEFALFSTGDNDDRDCWHTAFTLDFTLNYVE